MKVLNLYAGIGGNRKLWKDVEVTAVEIDEQIASIYRDFFPNDEMIITDAHSYLEKHYDEGWDFIWSSPPCPSHSRVRNFAGVGKGQVEPIYPNLELYEEIIFLTRLSESKGIDFQGSWVVENVVSYYEPLIRPQKLHNHYFWANFYIPKIQFEGNRRHHSSVEELEEYKGFDLSEYDLSRDKKVKLLRSAIHPELGKHILESGVKKKQMKLS